MKSIYYLFIGRVVYALIFVPTKLIFASRFIALTGIKPQNEQNVESLSSAFPVIALFQLVIMAPILEELIFRYVIYHFLKKINRGFAMIISSLFFRVSLK